MDSDTKNAVETEATLPQPQGDTAKTLAAHLAAPCEVRVVERAGRYTLSIPELGLLVTGKELGAAHAELMRQRERRLKEFAAEGILGWLPRPEAQGGATATALGGRSLLSQLKPFLIKAAIVTAMFLGAVNVIGQGLGDTGYKLEKQLEGLSNWTPEKIEWHRERAQKIAEKLGPTIRELVVMFRDPAPVVPAIPAVPVASPDPAAAAAPPTSVKP
jgi:hypothetical protein